MQKQLCNFQLSTSDVNVSQCVRLGCFRKVQSLQSSKCPKSSYGKECSKPRGETGKSKYGTLVVSVSQGTGILQHVHLPPVVLSPKRKVNLVTFLWRLSFSLGCGFIHPQTHTHTTPHQVTPLNWASISKRSDFYIRNESQMGFACMRLWAGVFMYKFLYICVCVCVPMGLNWRQFCPAPSPCDVCLYLKTFLIIASVCDGGVGTGI